jgi:hypothetical protein
MNLYTVIRTRFLTGIARETYQYREPPRNPNAFLHISHKISINQSISPFLEIVLHCLLKTQLPEDRQPLTSYYKVPLIIERNQFLAPLPGSFGLFKRQFRGTRLSVDHSIGNFIPFFFNFVFILFVYFVVLIYFVLLCMSVWVRNSKGKLETSETLFGSLFDTPTSSSHLLSWLKKE